MFTSDAVSWEQYLAVFDLVAPDLVMMGGDLVSEGFAVFWNETDRLIITLPKLRDRLIAFLKAKRSIFMSEQPCKYKKVIQCVKSGYTGEIYIPDIAYASSPIILADMLTHDDDNLHDEFHDLWWKLGKEARNSSEFIDYVNQNHISKFYEALEYSGRKCRAVFVVAGDHDLRDFPREYDPKRITSFRNVHEISGKSVVFENLRILGLGYSETHYLRKLRPLIALHHDKVDVVLTHAEERRMSLIATIKPQLILRGHFREKIYDIDDIQVASAGFPSYVVAKVEGNTIKDVEYKQPEKQRRSRTILLAAPDVTKKTDFKLYERRTSLSMQRLADKVAHAVTDRSEYKIELRRLRNWLVRPLVENLWKYYSPRKPIKKTIQLDRKFVTRADTLLVDIVDAILKGIAYFNIYEQHLAGKIVLTENNLEDYLKERLAELRETYERRRWRLPSLERDFARYIKHPTTLTTAEKKKLFDDTFEVLKDYDITYFHYNPGKLHPLYRQLVDEMRRRDRKIQEIIDLDDVAQRS